MKSNLKGKVKVHLPAIIFASLPLQTVFLGFLLLELFVSICFLFIFIIMREAFGLTITIIMDISNSIQIVICLMSPLL